MPEFTIKNAYRWSDWPDRERLTNLPRNDSGIDLVAITDNDEIVAIQCKCYKEKNTIQRANIDSFLAVSNTFDARWIVATCKWGRNANDIINDINPPVSRIDFHEYDAVSVIENKIKLEKREPKPLQKEAIKSIVTRLPKAERGQLIMACGTGKTYTALKITEKIVPDGGRILFLAPSIALVSQARREWLRYSARPLSGLVVCSDRTTGGSGENEDIRISELECSVTTDPEKIASELKDSKNTFVVFCTYQSLEKVCEAQSSHGLAEFDMIVADEAHRTTGIENSSEFHLVHKKDELLGKKRLYMTATPRVYTAKSKNRLERKGHTVFDMEDHDVFGEVMHRLTFKAAVDAGMLSDYRVSIIVMRKQEDTTAIYDKFLLTTGDEGYSITYEDVERLLGTAFAINGIVGEHGSSERLPRVLGFANSRKRSKAFRDLLNLSDLHKIINERMGSLPDEPLTMHNVIHLDGNSSAIDRNHSLRVLEKADNNSPHMICNVKLFTEGVDVPSLDAVAFLDPRDSMVDIVQAVGRVMRSVPGKKFGHIIIPVPMEGENLIDELESNQEGWKATGRVLRALQAHDSRLPENPLHFIQIYDPLGNDDNLGSDINGIQNTLEFQKISEKFYTKVVSASGLAKPGQMTSDEIESVVIVAGRIFMKSNLANNLASILGLEIGSDEYKESDVCKIAALLVVNACLLHRRIQNESKMNLATLDEINGSDDPCGALINSWEAILKQDYRPIFEPSLNVIKALPGTVKNAIYRIVDRANSVADTLSELGYDHAGPLYHKVLGTARSDSANYTDNISALMLARLAFQADFTNWKDVNNIQKLRIIDPACGTGTLLMAAVKIIKDRMNYDDMSKEDRDLLHRKLIENVICGLDINRHAIQLAACNLTLGAPTINYKNMNLYTMQHGPQPDGSVKAGSLEILHATGQHDIMKALVQPMKSIGDFRAEHIDNMSKGFPLNNLDVVIMNPPYGSNVARSSRFSKDVKKRMQENELDIKNKLKQRDKKAGDVIDSNSIRTFFTPVADRLLNLKHGTLAKVLPVTACTSTSGLAERKFLASKFNVECIITSHDPKHVNFSYKTDIHECLMICRRCDGVKPPTRFVSLRKMPTNSKEAINTVNNIISGNANDFGTICEWPNERVKTGNWTPAQWYDPSLADIIFNLESLKLLESIGSRYEIGPDGRQLRGNAYKACDANTKGAVRIFWSVSGDLRKTINAEPESWRIPRDDSAKKLWERKSKLLISAKFRTTNGRLTAIYSKKASIGNGWIPVSVTDENMAKAMAAWWNSTPVRLMLLNRRSKILDYPQWSLTHLKEIRIPKPDNPNWAVLHSAYNETCDNELLPLSQAMEDDNRKIIDDAAAVMLDVNPNIIEKWRELLSKEPTITNKRYDIANTNPSL